MLWKIPAFFDFEDSWLVILFHNEGVECKSDLRFDHFSVET